MFDGIGKQLGAELTTPESLFAIRQALSDLLKENTVHIEAQWDSASKKVTAEIVFKPGETK